VKAEAEEEPLGHRVLAEGRHVAEAPAPRAAGGVANGQGHAVDDPHRRVDRAAGGERGAVVPPERGGGGREVRRLTDEGRPVDPR
jgi:hypothetical protein